MAATPDSAPHVVARAPRADVAAATPIARQLGYGGLVTRTLAAAVDAAIINVVALSVAGIVSLVLSIFPVGHDAKQVLAIVGGAAFAIWVIAYFVVCWSGTGQTPGDRMMHIRVVRLDGKRVSPMRALLRLGGAVLGLVLLLGYIPILLSEHRRAFHDWLAGTVVIETQTKGTAP